MIDTYADETKDVIRRIGALMENTRISNIIQAKIDECDCEKGTWHECDRCTEFKNLLYDIERPKK